MMWYSLYLLIIIVPYMTVDYQLKCRLKKKIPNHFLRIAPEDSVNLSNDRLGDLLL